MAEKYVLKKSYDLSVQERMSRLELEVFFSLYQWQKSENCLKLEIRDQMGPSIWVEEDFLNFEGLFDFGIEGWDPLLFRH